MSDVLPVGERGSAAWIRLKKFYEGRLAELRAQNDTDLTPEKTARLRGRIAEVKALLSLGEDKPQASTENDLFKD